MKNINVLYNGTEYNVVKENNDPVHYNIYCNGIIVNDNNLCNKIYSGILSKMYDNFNVNDLQNVAKILSNPLNYMTKSLSFDDAIVITS